MWVGVRTGLGEDVVRRDGYRIGVGIRARVNPSHSHSSPTHTSPTSTKSHFTLTPTSDKPAILLLSNVKFAEFNSGTMATP